MYKIRPVERKDCIEIFKLSNDPLVREMSLFQKEIDYPEHLEWFERMLADKSIQFFVVTVDEKLAAQVRFKLADDNAEISISIAEGFRGAGYSCKIMKDAIDCLRTETDVKTLTAVVRKSNARSVNFFYKSGYTLSSEKIINDIDCLILEYRIRR